MTVRGISELRDWKRAQDEDATAGRGPDEYSRILGADWVSMGDGTYRYVGKQHDFDWEEPAAKSS